MSRKNKIQKWLIKKNLNKGLDHIVFGVYGTDIS